ncbi:exported protein of unknown function [Nitrososphaera viennensis EN76]|uniref:Uncharacterized protein n=1 Tax=Nitrososphaera viennensis EN76 TaxID=926571 RepID=A0A060HHI1_9ARCH|nr:exported protein of unknown function [Nitrososphaera viennensis EN76]
MANHFWVGSLCLRAPSSSSSSTTLTPVSSTTAHVKRPPSPSYPPNVIAISDTLTILEDLGNHIPDKSWMLYLLELFDKNTAAALELDLICQFNDRDNFWAIFRGINRYKFTKVLPAVGHSYLREIIMKKEKKSIEFSLTDLSTEQNEAFVFDVSSEDNNKGFSYQGGNHFTGIEWWNKAGGSNGNTPFPVRYKVEVSNLSFGQATYDDGMSTRRTIDYRPYNMLIPNRDGVSGVKEYPVSFENPAVKDDGKNIRYAVASGKTIAGIRFISNPPGMPEAV